MMSVSKNKTKSKRRYLKSRLVFLSIHILSLVEKEIAQANETKSA